MSDICKNCKHFQDNVTPEKIEIEDFCVGSLGSDGYYTWGTPMWKNMDKNIWNAVSNQMAFSSPERESDCFAFSRQDRPCTCGSGEPWASCGAGSQYCG